MDPWSHRSTLLYLQVLPQRVHAGQRGAAGHAGQRGAPWVRALLVHLQGALLDEVLAAGEAAEGPLARVDPLVALQRVRLVEALAARVALERLLARVDA